MSVVADTPEMCEGVVREFLKSWTDGSLDKILDKFSDDAVYHNVPVDPIVGIDNIRQIFKIFLDVFSDVKLDIVNLAAADGVVLVERVDRFVMTDGRIIELPVSGVFEVREGRITRFSDYFDLASFEKQSGMKL